VPVATVNQYEANYRKYSNILSFYITKDASKNNSKIYMSASGVLVLFYSEGFFFPYSEVHIRCNDSKDSTNLFVMKTKWQD